MIDFVLVYDDEDPELGHYFKSCAEDVIQLLKNKDFNIILARASNLNAAFIDLKLSVLNKRFIFAAFSHGTDSALAKKEGVPYLNKETDASMFSGAFLYTIACHAGKDLGKRLNAKGCIFWGYSREVDVLLPYKPLFKACDLFGLKVFLKGKTIDYAFDRAVRKYNSAIDNLKKIDIIAASCLMRNRDAMVRYGGDKKTILYFDTSGKTGGGKN